MDKEAYNAGENQSGGLGIQTENRTPALRACGTPAIAYGFKGGQSSNGGLGDEREVAPTLAAQPSALEPTVAFAFENNHLVGEDCARTLSGDHESRVTDTGQSIVVGLDLYNQAETGEAAMPVTAAASDPHHVPCVATGFSHANGNTSMESKPAPECAFTIRRSPAGEGAVAIRIAQTGANGCGIADEAAYTLDRAEGQAVAIGCDRRNQTGCDEVQPAIQSTVSDGGSTCAVSGSAGEYVVRRLTPRECERLQGFPDDWTLVPYRGKPAEECPDGPRYKAMGNSWGTNCAEWILRRLLAARPVWHPEPDEPSTTERTP